MTIQECHYQFKLGMDRIDTQSSEDFTKAEIDWLLNEARMIFLKRRYSADHNLKHKGFENSQIRIDDLSTLVIKYPQQPALTPNYLNEGVYEVDLNLLAESYLHLLSAYAKVNLGNDCIKTVNLKFMQHDDYREAIKDPFNSPSVEFIPYNFGRSATGNNVPSIYLYGGTLPASSITDVFLEYIKTPVQVSFGGYTYINGITYPPTDLDFPEHTHQEIVDIACQIAALNIETPDYVQLKNQKVFAAE